MFNFLYVFIMLLLLTTPIFVLVFYFVSYSSKNKTKMFQIILSVFISFALITLIIILVNFLYQPSIYRSLHSFLTTLHSREKTSGITSLVSAGFSLFIVNMFFDCPNWFLFLKNYQLKENSQLTKTFLQLSIFSVLLGLFIWQDHNSIKIFSTEFNIISYTGLFAYLYLALLLSVLILAFFSFLFHRKLFRSLLLQPKSANFAVSSPNHYDIDDLIKSEQKNNNSEFQFSALEEKLQELSFKNSNNLYK